LAGIPVSGLTLELASRFAQITLGHQGQQWPYKPDHVLTGPGDVRTPEEVHPIFHGSFDWHSCVHGWWQVMTLLRRFPDLPEAPAIRVNADAMLVPEKVAGEVAYLSRPSSSGFSRPYGWAWALALHGELARHEAAWANAFEPLARVVAAGFRAYLPKLTYPIRVGTHFNSSFALTLARDWALAHDPDLVGLIDSRAYDWFGEDRDCQAWEPGGDEFLSSALCESLLMSRVLPPAGFTLWFDAFLPRAAAQSPGALFTPAHVSDRSDGKIAHLDGLNLSRAWCWRSIAQALPLDHPAIAPAGASADQHLSASLPHLDDDYMGSHWLATFALLALGT